MPGTGRRRVKDTLSGPGATGEDCTSAGEHGTPQRRRTCRGLVRPPGTGMAGGRTVTERGGHRLQLRPLYGERAAGRLEAVVRGSLPFDPGNEHHWIADGFARAEQPLCRGLLAPGHGWRSGPYGPPAPGASDRAPHRGRTVDSLPWTAAPVRRLQKPATRGRVDSLRGRVRRDVGSPRSAARPAPPTRRMSPRFPLRVEAAPVCGSLHRPPADTRAPVMAVTDPRRFPVEPDVLVATRLPAPCRDQPTGRRA